MRKPKISARVQKAIDLLASGKERSITAAAAHVGVSREHLQRSLAKPQVAAYREERIRQALAKNTLRASERIGELIDAKSEHVSLDASARVLSIAGYAPASAPSVAVNVNVSAGVVIDLTDPRGGAHPSADMPAPPAVDVLPVQAAEEHPLQGVYPGTPVRGCLPACGCRGTCRNAFIGGGDQAQQDQINRLVKPLR